jgi:uncharacterized membrane protein YfcA
VYLFRVQPVLATAYSLFIVGSTSLVGALPRFKQGLINLRTAIVFGVPSIITVFATRKFLLPLIPDVVFTVGDVAVTKDRLMMLLFALLMMFASVFMIRNQRSGEQKTPPVQQQFNYPLIFVEGIVVGLLTSLVGAGGGFLIIPAMVLLSKLPMKQAVGTSLLIIAANSLIGFIGDATNYRMDWRFLGLITGMAIIGIFIGNWLSTRVSGEKLKKSFGWFVLAMGAYILVKELFFTGNRSH